MDLNDRLPAGPGHRKLVLFDLDYTLLPIDSDYEWSRFLVRMGVVDGPEYERRNNEFFEQYKLGTLDIDAFLEFQLAPLAAHPCATLDGWHARYMDEVIRPAIREPALALVRRHLECGDLCAIVTATNEFVTAPIARAFGIEHLIATRVERAGDCYTGRTSGTPSFREGKIARTEEWLQSQGRAWTDFGESWFYSDSANDLPLLERVSHPVPTNPDPRLAAVADERGWPVLSLFE